MKLLALNILTLLSFIACGQESPDSFIWDSLPQEIIVLNKDIELEVSDAVYEINNELREIYQITNNQDARIIVDCADGKMEERQWGSCMAGGGYAYILIDCQTIPASKLSYIIAHELYHCLGFAEHSNNDDCLSSTHMDWNTQLKGSVCNEMKTQFEAVYGE